VAPITPAEFRNREQARYGGLLHAWTLEEDLAAEPLQLRVVRDSAYAQLIIRRFFKDGFDEPATAFPALLSEAFRRLEEARTPNLIIDLRGNGGGIGANVAHLVSYLVDRPFTPTTRMTFRGNDAYYRRITPDSLGLDEYFGLRPADGEFLITRSDRIGELGNFPPLGIRPYRGRVVVLIDGGTVSAAGMAAGLIRELTQASFVGREAGGYAGTSNGLRQLSVRGAHTQTGINFPLSHSEFGVSSHLRKRGVVPDYPVASSIDDMINGRDTALNFALALLR
jgi:C-terminal processing protease CtpA/Prc